MNRRQTESGLTLIELMIAIAIIAVILVAGMPSFSEWTTNLRIRTVSESVLDGLKTARMEAVKMNTNVIFTINPADPGWRVLRADNLAQLAQSDFGTTPVVTTLVPADTVSVTFNSMGQAMNNNPDGTPPLSQIDLTVPESLLASANARNLRVLISSGMLKLCDPNATGDARAC